MAATAANSSNKSSNNPRKILIVDEVDAYNDPFLALSNFKPNVYGLALLDIRMPKMTGLELYKKIKDIDNMIEVCFMWGVQRSISGSRGSKILC
jgi:two-component SAPR family response regulator